MLYMQLTHKNTYSFSGCYCSVFVSLFLSPISLVHLVFLWFCFFFFAGRKIQKVLKIMHINFLMCWFCLCFLADLLCLFPLDLKFPMQTTWREFGSLCWIFIPCCVLTGDAVKSIAIINRWIWIIPCEPDSHFCHAVEKRKPLTHTCLSSLCGWEQWFFISRKMLSSIPMTRQPNK